MAAMTPLKRSNWKFSTSRHNKRRKSRKHKVFLSNPSVQFRWMMEGSPDCVNARKRKGRPYWLAKET